MRRLVVAALALIPSVALAVGLILPKPKHPRRIPPSTAASTQEVVITGSDILIAQMRAAEPTVVYTSQAAFQVASWNQADYDEAALIKPCVAPCTGGALLPASLIGATITAVRMEITRSQGFFNTATTFSLKKVLRSDIVPAQMTWNLRATGSSWQTGGAQGALDADTALSTLAKTSADGGTMGVYSFETSAAFVAYFQALANGTETTPWLLLHPSASQGTYNTFDGPTGASPIRFIVTKQL